jgi:hypothetical protein
MKIRKKDKHTKGIRFSQNSRDGILLFMKIKFGANIFKLIAFGICFLLHGEYHLGDIFD